ncbi:unnamed protein product [Heligmosomoides polygyrus]|uniref:Uncharacterized protein n=1 Tax=Heligmosomoides polygyrus TaxID=6339 RepID=A0A183FS63_HELPZ|nr:unnamed protein product [Heligmosomoides polygyrus]
MRGFLGAGGQWKLEKGGNEFGAIGAEQFRRAPRPVLFPSAPLANRESLRDPLFVLSSRQPTCTPHGYIGSEDVRPNFSWSQQKLKCVFI